MRHARIIVQVELMKGRTVLEKLRYAELADKGQGLSRRIGVLADRCRFAVRSKWYAFLADALDVIKEDEMVVRAEDFPAAQVHEQGVEEMEYLSHRI